METDKTIKTSDGVSTLRTIITNHHGNVTHEHTQEVKPNRKECRFDRYHYGILFIILSLLAAGCTYADYLKHTGAL